jgi:hypothetical protein
MATLSKPATVWIPLREARRDAIARHAEFNGGDAQQARADAELDILHALGGGKLFARGDGYQFHMLKSGDSEYYSPRLGPGEPIPPIFWNQWFAAAIHGHGHGSVNWMGGSFAFHVEYEGAYTFMGEVTNVELRGYDLSSASAAAPVLPRRMTDDDRAAWIKAQSQMSADAGFKLFTAHPEYDGTKQPEFRKEWKEVRGTRIGRPVEKS